MRWARHKRLKLFAVYTDLEHLLLALTVAKNYSLTKMCKCESQFFTVPNQKHHFSNENRTHDFWIVFWKSSHSEQCLSIGNKLRVILSQLLACGHQFNLVLMTKCQCKKIHLIAPRLAWPPLLEHSVAQPTENRFWVHKLN